MKEWFAVAWPFLRLMLGLYAGLALIVALGYALNV